MKYKFSQESINTRKNLTNIEHMHVIEQDILVSDIYPDILKILNVNVKNNITNIVSKDNAIIIQGRLIYKVLYKAIDGTEKYRVISSKSTYKIEVPTKEDLKEANINVLDNIINVAYNMPNERKVYIKTDILFNICIQKKYNVKFAKGFIDKVECEKKIAKKQIKNIINEKEVNHNTREEINLKAGLPDIYEIIEETHSINKPEYKVSYNKIIIKADLVGSIKYLTQKDEKNAYENTYSIPITGFIELDSIPNNAQIDVFADLTGLEISINPNNIKSTSLIMDIEAKFKAVITENKEIEYIEDLYFLDKEIADKIETESLSCMGDMESKSIDINMEVNNSIKDGEELITIAPENITLNNKGNYLEGTIDLNIVVNKLKDMDSRKVTGSLKTDVENGKIESWKIKNITYTYSQNNISIKIQMDITICMEENIDVIVKEEIEVNDIEENKYKSIMICTKKEGEDMWDIAKKYKTTIENINKANEKISSDNKLLIMR